MYAMNTRPPAIHLNISDPNDPHDVQDDPELGLANDATNASTVPTLWGIPLKYLSLVTLAVQNSLLTLIMHYSRVSTPPSRAYSPATAVLMNEILKGSISFIIAFSRIDLPPPEVAGQTTTLMSRIKRLAGDIFSQDCWKLSIPAILYVIQNNLQFVAVSNLQAATFQVSYQMKILTTAGFSVLLLRKKLTSPQWVALLFLAIGVGVVQIQAGAVRVVQDGVVQDDTHTMNAMKGFIAVATACLTSGLAGVYFEMVLKNTQTDLWVRNVQLSLFSLLPALAPVFYLYASDPQDGWIPTLFRNFGGWAWGTVSVQVFGGLLTALVIKYSDNILKGFATSLSIVISFLASVALFDFQITFTFIIGSFIVLVATWLYNHQPKRPESISWALGWPETWRSGSAMRSPAVAPYNTLSTSTSSSRSSSALSLNSLAKPDTKDSLLFAR
ncbi:nucleotide-sugar transporter-domain-containing protein [Mycena maculata]|uniref:Nucleotide-sugar transporter-domain-containing protein n=1 Tax=Mycena maculata TaxID=230809 RepID=A0AAD7NTI2_9AGAR|nr:nucleotide-sugar transporter-domain-containing protein [Mycena maculata]